MLAGLFVTGTDTDVGKTWISALLAYAFGQKTKIFYHKPIQAGFPTDSERVRGWLKDLSIHPSAYELKEPASPNRAARKESIHIHIPNLLQNLKRAPQNHFGIIEGAGGLEVPINERETIADLAKQLRLPVVVVASTKLGTINHTLLTLARLKEKNIPCLGLILNGPEDPGLKELLESRGGVPVLFECSQKKDLSYETLAQEWQSNQALQDFVGAQLDQNLSVDQKKSQTYESAQLMEWDQRHVWHPFTQHGLVKEHPLVEGAHGAYLKIDGHEVIDGISSWWVNLFGHCHPQINAAIHDQVESLDHVVFAGLSHQPAIELSQRLIALTQEAGCDHQRVFFSDNGSTAVEVALKMAYQYQRLRGATKRQTFLAFSGSYHGDTLGAMSVGARGSFHSHFESLLFDVKFVDPWDLTALRDCFAEQGENLAAVIFEPMVQGAGGMRMYPAETLNELQRLAKQHDVLTIADEIFTGFYRTGELFAFRHSELRPDLLCLSKGLTAGYLPLSVTLAPEKIFEAFKSESMAQAFLHGHSYTANPIACRVACASLDLLSEAQTQKDIQQLVSATSEQLSNLSERLPIHQPRQLGTLAAFEVGDPKSSYFNKNFAREFHSKALKKGVLLRPLGNTLYTLPPYCVSKHDVEQIYQVITEILTEET